MVFSLPSLQVLILCCISAITVLTFCYLFSLKQKEELKNRLTRVILSARNQRDLKNVTSISFLEYCSEKLLLFQGKSFFKQLTLNTSAKYRTRFEQAGWDSQQAVLIVSVVNTGLTLFSILFCLFLMLKVKQVNEQILVVKILIFGIITLLSMRSFEYFIDFMIKSRYDKIRKGLTYAIDLLGICSRSGYSLERSFEKIAESIIQFNTELSKEFTKTAIELTIIPERNVALRNLAKRVDIPLVQILVSGLIQAQEQGSPLSGTLKNMSLEFSKQKMLDIEAKAGKLPALLTLPLVLFLIPAILTVLMGPAIHEMSNSDFFRS